MFSKILGLLLTIASFSLAENSDNWTGWLDTVQIDSFVGTNTVYSKKSMSLTDYDMVRLICMVDDTASAGFASDSINFAWGYQTYSLCFNSANTVDTCYAPAVTVDTIKTAYLGSFAKLTLDANGIAATPTRKADTLHTSGYAVQSRTFAPEWDTFYKIWVTGLTGNKTGAPLKLLFDSPRRLYRGVRSK